MPPADTRRVVPTPPHALRRSASSRHCACTFYLVFKEPATWCSRPHLSAGRDHVPHQLYFLEGNLAILQSVHLSVNSFLVARRFSSRRFREGHTRMAGKVSTVSGGFARSRCDLGVRAGGSVSTSRSRASSERVTLGPTNIRGPSGTVNTGNRPNCQLVKTRVTDWLVEL